MWVCLIPTMNGKLYLPWEERVGPRLPLIFWERQVKEIRFLLYSLLEQGLPLPHQPIWLMDISLLLWEREGVAYRCLFSSVQLLSRVQFSATPWTAARQASLSITSSWSLLKLMSLELVNCSMGTWFLGPKAVRVGRASCLVLILLSFPALWILSCRPGPAGPQEAKLQGLHCQAPLSPAFKLQLANGRCQRRLGIMRRETQAINFSHSLPAGKGCGNSWTPKLWSQIPWGSPSHVVAVPTGIISPRVGKIAGFCWSLGALPSLLASSLYFPSTWVAGRTT